MVTLYGIARSEYVGRIIAGHPQTVAQINEGSKRWAPWNAT